jgi:GT2 family glycosyltransferase
MPRFGARRGAELLLVAAGALTGAGVGYLLILTAAAAVGRRTGAVASAGEPALRFVVLIPAHDEERALPHTLDGLAALEYPRPLLHVLVIADNCADATAEVAAARGAMVLERRSAERGKGAALAWGLARLPAVGLDHDAVLFLDADCAPSANLLAAVDRRMRAGAEAVQAAYVVSNPGASRSAALRFASFALVNTVRPWGREVLGLSCGILGSGFAVRRDIVEKHGWSAFSLTEDTEYHLQLLEAGVRVRFAPEASVSSPMPTSLRGSREQHARWESGKFSMLREWAPRLLARGVRRRDPQLVHAALEGLVPSQSVLAASGVVVAICGLLLRSRAAVRLGLASTTGQALYVLGGLALARAPAAVYRALVFAPGLVAWKLLLYLRLLTGRTPRRWVRTERYLPAARGPRGTLGL